MDQNVLLEGLISYICFIPLLTFHEFAHAWTAWKCGDDTAYDQGRVTLNPVMHMEVLGTVVLPLLAIFLSGAGSGAASFIIGWGRPVPVNISRLRHPRRDDTLVAIAGPAINILLAVVLLIIARIALSAGLIPVMEIAGRMAHISLLLCFFNMLPIPPLDGSHVLKNMINMSYETYYRLCQYGFIMVIIAIQLKPVRAVVWGATDGTFELIARLLGFK